MWRRTSAQRFRTSSPEQVLGLILAAAFALRVAVAVYGRHLQQAPDPYDYLRHATSIANGHGFPATVLADPGTPSALRPPAFPYLLGATLSSFVHPPFRGFLIEALPACSRVAP